MTLPPTSIEAVFDLLGERPQSRLLRARGWIARLAQMQRRVAVDDPRRRLWVTSVPDQVLRKLDWYRRGGETSDRQWRDVGGLLVTHLDSLDLEDLRQVAEETGLVDLLEQALLQAGENIEV